MCIAALVFSYHSIPIEDIVSVDKYDYIYDKLSINMLFLEMTLLVFGLGVAVLTFFGYQSIKEAAIRKAVEKAKEKL